MNGFNKMQFVGFVLWVVSSCILMFWNMNAGVAIICSELGIYVLLAESLTKSEHLEGRVIKGRS